MNLKFDLKCLNIQSLQVLCHKTNEVDGSEDAKSWRHGRRSREADGDDGRCTASRASLWARRDGCRTSSKAIRRPRWERYPGPRRGCGNLPTHGFSQFSQCRPSTGLSRTNQNCGRIVKGMWRHRRGCVESKQSICSTTVIRWTMMYLFGFAPMGLLMC